MTKQKTIFACQKCGQQYPKWLGRCNECKSWNTIVEETYDDPGTKSIFQASRDIATKKSALTPINEIDTDNEQRLISRISEFDRVTGGGLVPGSVLLIGGDPGIGKSTLVLQILSKLAGSGLKVLYITGEESASQVKLRADRLKISDETLIVGAMNDISKLTRAVTKIKPAVLVVDSIQTVYTPDLSSAPGSVSQVRESAMRITGLSKREGIASLLIGHVTKDGALAGPRVLEHMVDCVLSFEGDRGYPYRILRATKNRFGSTNEVGVFEMTKAGLMEIDNPSMLFLAERPVDEPGSVVTVSLEGTRPLLVEVQALVSPTSFGTPRRTCIGVDPNRIALLAAVLEKKGGLDLVGCDIFVNIAGGVKISEPAIDLGLAVSLASSLIDKPISKDTLVFGEVGLAGELRSVSQPDLRLKEAAKMGFRRAVMPGGDLSNTQATDNIPDNISVEYAKNIAEVIDILF